MGTGHTGLASRQRSIRHQQEIGEEPLPRGTLQSFFIFPIYSYLQLHTVPNPAFSENLRQACVGRLLACLADLSGQTTVVKSSEKSLKVAAVASDGEFWVAKVIDTIQALEEDTKHVSLLTQTEDEEISLRKKVLRLTDRLKDVCESFFLIRCAY